jgi:hypothetical protein
MTNTTATMTVTVRDRSAEAAWGVGLIRPVTRTITISAHCPVCGEKRGEPQGLNQCDDGAYYWVQVWTNPCGHTDMYANVVIEADDRLLNQLGSATPEDAPADKLNSRLLAARNAAEADPIPPLVDVDTAINVIKAGAL